MELHHDKHHQAYVTNLNKALEVSAAALAEGDLANSAAQLSAIRFNGGGHINHSLFWELSFKRKYFPILKRASALKGTLLFLIRKKVIL